MHALVQAVVSNIDKERGRISLSTKKLEATPGDMLRDPKRVYEGAEAFWQREDIKVRP